MKINNSFVAKIGSAGKRNRQARRRIARRSAYHIEKGHQNPSTPKLPTAKTETVTVQAVDFSGIWNELVAKQALAMFSTSGLSQKVFATTYGFNDSKIRFWKKKLETQTG